MALTYDKPPGSAASERQTDSSRLAAQQRRKTNQILLLVMLMVGLGYVARVNLSIAGHDIQQQLHFNTVVMGWLFSAFLLGYALMQVPSGWAADRFGPRRVVTVALLVWAVFTVLTGMVPELPLSGWIGLVGAFLVIQFMVGVGQAAGSPAGNKLAGNWIGSHRRGWGASFNVIGIGLGGAVTPPLMTWVMRRWGWEWSFYVCGALGVVFALIWYLWVRNRPQEWLQVRAAHTGGASQPQGNLAASKTPARAPVPWGRLLKSRSVWGLLGGYFCQGYPIYFYYTWLFIYLTRVRGLTVQHAGVWGMLPYLAIAAMAPFGGLCSDALSRRLGKKSGRRIAACTGFLASALLMWLGSRSASSITAVLLLAGASGSNMFGATTFWATCIDLTPEFAGSLSGLMNMFGNLGGWLSPIITAYVAVELGWQAALLVAALVTVAAALFFVFLVDADHCLDAPAETSV